MRAAIASLLVALAVASAAAEEKRITLPADNDYAKLASAPHSDLTQTQCQLCHSTDYIVMQPRGNAKQWEAVVTKMIKVFGAPTSEADAKAITEYLTSAYGHTK
jgi:cytochrome c5